MEITITPELYNSMMDFIAKECATYPSVKEKFAEMVREYEGNLD